MGNATLQEKIMTLPTRFLAQSSFDGALPTMYAATAPDVPPGAYVGPSKRMETVGPPTLVQGNGRSRDVSDGRRLWEASEQLTGVHYEFASAVTA